MKRFFASLISVVMALILVTPVSALTESQLNMFAQNNILFYDPSGVNNNCGSPLSNGEYIGTQYSLTDEEIRGLARVAQHENGCSLEAFKTELSIMANLYEKNGHGQGLVEYVIHGNNGKNWFAKNSRDDYSKTSIAVSDEKVQAVRDVLVNGRRTLPQQILEHDCTGDLEWVELDGKKYYGENPGGCKGTGLSDKSLYVQGKTIIHNKYGSTYVFWQWAGGPNGCGDPFGYFESDPPTEASYSITTTTNANYAGAQVWKDAELQAVQNFKPVYEKVAKNYGFPWQILAVLHQKEHSLQKSNPDNGQGVYQLYSYTDGGQNENRFAPGDITDEEFERQTDLAAQVVKSKMSGLDLNKPDDVKKLFFRYNGAASEYVEKAIKMGFTQEQADNGEGSPYVMNRFDARRDPKSASMDPLWEGRYEADGKYVADSTSYRFGAFVLYAALTGTGNGNSYCSGGAGGTILQTALSLAKLGENNGTGSYIDGDKDPSPEYKKALESYGATAPCRNSAKGDCAPLGASCDQFVATVMIYSGADPQFPRSYPPGQRDYMLQHPEKYQQIKNNNHDFSVLQPGDILVSTGDKAGERHIFIYGGERDGVQTQIGASYNMHTAFVYRFWDQSWTVEGHEYLIFRMLQ